MRFFLFLLISCQLTAQDFDYYYIGDTTDISTSASFGICLMGGATENDNGSTWFLNKADGGNVVVLRASGSDGYNDYFYNQLGVNMQSVETIVFNNATAAQNSFVQRRIENAEAIWIAGGDQFLYESYWKGGPIELLINEHVNVKDFPLGGTSAGMAILGDYYFTAENGTVTSADALNDPFGNAVTLGSDFINLPYLNNTVTDTHYDNPDRKGRQTVFMAHMIVDNSLINFGIASDEYVAICMEEDGKVSVFGDYPNYDDFAYFLRTNCDLVPPSQFASGQPLTWNPAGGALEVYVMPGTPSGQNVFDLNNWENINGGAWESWSVENGTLNITPSTFESCNLSLQQNESIQQTEIYPNPSNEVFQIASKVPIERYELSTSSGKIVQRGASNHKVLTAHLDNGIYILHLQFGNSSFETHKIIVQH